MKGMVYNADVSQDVEKWSLNKNNYELAIKTLSTITRTNAKYAVE